MEADLSCEQPEWRRLLCEHYFNVCLYNNNLFHILNEHVHMLGKKTGVQSVHN